jgi:hypothetical protein
MTDETIDSELEVVALKTDLAPGEASRDIAKSVSARHSIARKHILRIRRRNPAATPAEVIQILERHYSSAITTAGAVIAAAAIAADVGIAMIPVAGAAAAGAKSASQQAAKKAGKEAAKAVVKGATKTMALGVAKGGAQQVALLLPAGDEQLQFEITAVFGLAIADIHAMDLDKDQAHALVYGLTNERVSQQQIAVMATDVARVAPGGVVGVGQTIAAGRSDWSHWATTLADALPGGAAQNLVRTIQTGQLEEVRETLSGKQQSAIEYGIGAVTGGVERFVFGRQVVASSRLAFPDPPDLFPSHLAIPDKPETTDDEGEPNRALAAMDEAAKATGNWIVGSASAIGGGVTIGVIAATRSFRSVDVDGDGIPDEPQALTTVKGVGGAVAGAADTVTGGLAKLFRPKDPS